MKCPYCHAEMQKGLLSGDGRSAVHWKVGDKKAGFLDKIGGSGKVEAATYTLASFTIAADYCEGCKKMIFETEISK